MSNLLTYLSRLARLTDAQLRDELIVAFALRDDLRRRGARASQQDEAEQDLRLLAEEWHGRGLGREEWERVRRLEQ